MRSLTLALVVALAQQAAPPAGVAPSTPADCVRATRDFIIKRQQQLRPPTGMTADIVRQVEL